MSCDECGSCRAPLLTSDQHKECIACLGHAHTEAALTETSFSRCESISEFQLWIPGMVQLYQQPHGQFRWGGTSSSKQEGQFCIPNLSCGASIYGRSAGAFTSFLYTLIAPIVHPGTCPQFWGHSEDHWLSCSAMLNARSSYLKVMLLTKMFLYVKIFNLMSDVEK